MADPPYLGRAQRWYGTGRGPGRNRAQTGRGGRQPPPHPDAATWDDPATHQQLIADLTMTYDGWALAAAPDSLATLLAAAPQDVIVGVWHRPNAIPGGGRVLRSWEPVIFAIPPGRRHRNTGTPVRDVLSAAVRPQGFLGSKPPEWTRWVLGILGYDPGLDELEDLFPGSGAITAAAAGMLPLPPAPPSPADNVIALRDHTHRRTATTPGQHPEPPSRPAPDVNQKPI